MAGVTLGWGGWDWTVLNTEVQVMLALLQDVSAQAAFSSCTGSGLEQGSVQGEACRWPQAVKPDLIITPHLQKLAAWGVVCLDVRYKQETRKRNWGIFNLPVRCYNCLWFLVRLWGPFQFLFKSHYMGGAGGLGLDNTVVPECRGSRQN